MLVVGLLRCSHPGREIWFCFFLQAVLGNQRLGAALGGLGKLGETMGSGERERRDKDRLGGVCLWTARANEKPGKEH